MLQKFQVALLINFVHREGSGRFGTYRQTDGPAPTGVGKRARACILVLTKSRGWKKMVVHDALTAPDVKAMSVFLPSCFAAVTFCWLLMALLPLS